MLRADYDAYAAAWGQEQVDSFVDSWRIRLVPQVEEGLTADRCYFLADYAGDAQQTEEAFLGALDQADFPYSYTYTTKLSTWMELMGLPSSPTSRSRAGLICSSCSKKSSIQVHSLKDRSAPQTRALPQSITPEFRRTCAAIR